MKTFQIKVLGFTPTVDIHEAAAMASLVATPHALLEAIRGVVHHSPDAASDMYVRFNSILRRRNYHQKCHADQKY